MHTVQSVSIGRYIELQSNVKLFNACARAVLCAYSGQCTHTHTHILYVMFHLRLYWIFCVHIVQCATTFEFDKETGRGGTSLHWKTDLIWIQHGTSSSLREQRCIVVMGTAEFISKHIENEREKLDLPTKERTSLTNTAYITSNTRTKTDEYIKIIIIINIMRRSVA